MYEHYLFDRAKNLKFFVNILIVIAGSRYFLLIVSKEMMNALKTLINILQKETYSIRLS